MAVKAEYGNWDGVRGIYAAGPIDAVTQEEARDWQDHLASLTTLAIFSPAHPYRNPGPRNADWLDEINRAAIDASGLIVAYMPKDRTAFGTIREIEYARAKDYPVVLVADHVKSLLAYDLYVVPTLEAAASLINGKKMPLVRGSRPEN